MPARVEPVNDTRSTPGCAALACPTVGPSPLTRLKTPRGTPAACNTSAKMIAFSGAISLGFSTIVQPAAAGWKSGAVRIERTGVVTVFSGSSAHGQGHETTWAQIAADVLGVPPEHVRVRHSDTQSGPQGVG